MPKDTYEIGQPWVTYHYPHDDQQATRRGLFALVNMRCLVCGGTEEWKVRWGQQRKIKHDHRGYAMERVKFLADHAHPDRGHPMSWALPLANVAAHENGLDVGLLAMRVEADLLRAATDDDSTAQSGDSAT